MTANRILSLIEQANAAGAYFKSPELTALGYRRCTDCRKWINFPASSSPKSRRCPLCCLAHNRSAYLRGKRAGGAA